MDPSEIFPADTQAGAEQKLLAALCQGSVDAITRTAILVHLQTHSFAIPDHQVVYRALVGIPVMDPTATLAALNVAMTRLGFPDLDLDAFFSTPPPANSEIASLLARLSDK